MWTQKLKKKFTNNRTHKCVTTVYVLFHKHHKVFSHFIQQAYKQWVSMHSYLEYSNCVLTGVPKWIQVHLGSLGCSTGCTWVHKSASKSAQVQWCHAWVNPSQRNLMPSTPKNVHISKSNPKWILTAPFWWSCWSTCLIMSKLVKE